MSISYLTNKVEELYRARRRAVFVALSGNEPPVLPYPDPSIPVKPPLRPSTVEGVSTEIATYWLDHCEKLTGRASDFDHETRRGYTIACRLLGLGWNDTQYAIGAASTSGPAAAATVWAGHMSKCDPRFVGSVYVARLASDPSVVKVGFSTNVAKRMKSLSRKEGGEVVLLNSMPGTMLNEWALHMELGHSVRPEWYPASAIPAWLLPAEQVAA